MTIRETDHAALSDAYRILLERALREIKMLRERMPEAAFGSAHCPICFRSYPHGKDIHEIEERILATSTECALNLPTIMRG